MYDLFTSPNIVILSVLSICWKTSFLLSLLLINPKTKNSSKEELVRDDMIKKPQNLSPFFYVSQYRNSNRFLGLCTDVDLQRIVNKRNTCFQNTFTTFFATRLPEVSSGGLTQFGWLTVPSIDWNPLLHIFSGGSGIQFLCAEYMKCSCLSNVCSQQSVYPCNRYQKACSFSFRHSFQVR